MAKYDITSLNYIATGQNRSFLNLDMQLDYYITKNSAHFLRSEHDVNSNITTSQGEGFWYPTRYIKHAEEDNRPISIEKKPNEIVLNEQQDNFIETDPSAKKNIRLYLSGDTGRIMTDIDNFNNNSLKTNQTYVLDTANTGNDKNNLTCDSSRILNMYDILDVTIKKQGAHSLKNLNVHETDLHHDIYLPQLDAQPIGFCQTALNTGYHNDVLVMTKQTTAGMSDLKTQFQDHINTTDDDITYTTYINGEKSNTYMYCEPSAALTFQHGFTPAKNYKDVQRSFIIDMPVDSRGANGGAADTARYDDGVQYYLRLHYTKNTLNSLYTTDICSFYDNDTHEMMNNCRQYCGIDSIAGQPYLKYYDNMTYDTIDISSDSLYVADTNIKNSYSFANDYRDILPYQKIEFIYPADHSDASQHKSNMFSIEILCSMIPETEQKLNDKFSTGHYDELDAMLSNRLFTLKTDIQHSIRQIVENISPVNTQLFDVTFGAV